MAVLHSTKIQIQIKTLNAISNSHVLCILNITVHAQGFDEQQTLQNTMFLHSIITQVIDISMHKQCTILI